MIEGSNIIYIYVNFLPDYLEYRRTLAYILHFSYKTKKCLFNFVVHTFDPIVAHPTKS